MHRRTKIVCTLGPATSDRDTLHALVEAGMDVARINFSHGDHEGHRALVRHVREASEAVGRRVSVLQDLQGPKIRVGNIQGESVHLEPGKELILTAKPPVESTSERVFIDYDSLAEDVEEGGRILLDDGLLELRVVGASEGEVRAEVVIGGELKSRKGVNLPHIRTSTPALTDKDLRDLELGLELDVDLIALSFVRSSEDVAVLNQRIREAGKNTAVIAKVEKPEAVRDMAGVIHEADGIMVARGDLGIEMDMADVPATQKMLIKQCLASAKPVITATQMLESMIENSRPTRAEASDVANAVLDGSDAVMLSGETAVGKYPVRVVKVMSHIISQAESYRQQYRPRLDQMPGDVEGASNITESVSFTACRLAEQVGAKAIACLTSSGTTARNIARHRPSMPIFAFTDRQYVVGHMGVLWGTKACVIPFQRDTDAGVDQVHRTLRGMGVVGPGDLIVITAGMPLPARGRTNMVHVSRLRS